MADSFTPTLNLRKPEVGHADDVWGGVAGLNGDLDLLDAIFLSTGLGTAVGLHVGSRTLAGGSTPTDFKLLVDGNGTVDALADGVTFRDKTDPTKTLKLLADLITTATGRTLHAPDKDGTIALMSDVQQAMPTGTKLDGYWGATPPAGFVFANGLSIGDATSGATNRANADTVNLFTRFWSFNDNTRFPLQNPDGSAATRGATAAADFAAHKRITLPDHSGAVTAGRDDLSGTNRNRLSAFAPNNIVRGALIGAQTRNESVGGSCSVSVSVSVGVSGTLTGAASANATAGGGSGAGPMCGDQSPVVVSGSMGGSGSGSGGGSISGTATTYPVQPTIICDVVIAL